LDLNTNSRVFGSGSISCNSKTPGDATAKFPAMLILLTLPIGWLKADQSDRKRLHYLLKGSQPIIVAMARGFKQKTEPELLQEVEKGRLLIITPFGKEVKRVTEKTAQIRNRMMLEMADAIPIGQISYNCNQQKHESKRL